VVWKEGVGGMFSMSKTRIWPVWMLWVAMCCEIVRDVPRWYCWLRSSRKGNFMWHLSPAARCDPCTWNQTTSRVVHHNNNNNHVDVVSMWIFNVEPRQQWSICSVPPMARFFTTIYYNTHPKQCWFHFNNCQTSNHFYSHAHPIDKLLHLPATNYLHEIDS